MSCNIFSPLQCCPCLHNARKVWGCRFDSLSTYHLIAMVKCRSTPPSFLRKILRQSRAGNHFEPLVTCCYQLSWYLPLLSWETGIRNTNLQMQFVNPFSFLPLRTHHHRHFKQPVIRARSGQGNRLCRSQNIMWQAWFICYCQSVFPRKDKILKFISYRAKT